MDQQNIQEQARQALQGGAPMGNGATQPSMTPPSAAAQPPQGLPVPPPDIAMKLAQIASQLDPMILGTLIWRALKQHGETMNAQGMQDIAT